MKKLYRSFGLRKTPHAVARDTSFLLLLQVLHEGPPHEYQQCATSMARGDFSAEGNRHIRLTRKLVKAKNGIDITDKDLEELLEAEIASRFVPFGKKQINTDNFWRIVCAWSLIYKKNRKEAYRPKAKSVFFGQLLLTPDGIVKSKFWAPIQPPQNSWDDGIAAVIKNTSEFLITLLN